MAFPYTSGEVLTADDLNQSSGLIKIIPSAAVGGSVTTGGSVTIGSGVSSVTVYDAFSSTFDNYRIVIGIETVSGGGVEIALVLGSTTTGYYHSQISVQFGGTVGGAGQTNDSEFRIGAARSTIGSPISLELNAPYLARETFMMSQSMYPFADATGGLRNFAGFLNDSTSYTAFTISPSSGTLTGGTISVYGYNNV